MSALPEISSLSPEEYLTAERLSESKSDYLNGIVVAMAGATYRHNLIAGNIFRHIGNAFAKRPSVVFNSDMKVRVDRANTFRYPDISALCGPIDFHDEEEDIFCNPQFICEVLSPSTERTDRVEKFGEYRLIETFSEYLIVDQKTMNAELHRKGSDNVWTKQIYTGAEEAISLESINVELLMSNIYAKVEV